YLAATDAVAEAFRDVEAHQVAFLAGVQEAWRDLLDRFDPRKIEQRMGRESGLGGLLASRKARCWDAFTAFYQLITEEARDDFEALFGHKISRAYQEQVERHHEPPR
ncbi:MAG: type VI secretion system-associated FHA domain protein, partial [Burkholderiaceae bacterium]